MANWEGERSGTLERLRGMRRSMEGDLAMLARSIENSLPLGSLGLCIWCWSCAPDSGREVLWGV